ncbi:glutathione S-transferase family protein, partial [Variovorax paradoxus]|uniref:glutathione S-transferase family protein n=1 Tax=Variovorax paradoxus TaxID=34073 RepID=UPI001ABC08DF
MITLYHCANARSFRVLWMLEELGAPYQLEMLPFPPRVLQRDYLAIHPQGTVPLLVNGEIRMNESVAICQYLASLHAPTPLNVERDEAGYAQYLNWLHFGEASLTFPQALVLRYGTLEPQERRLPQAAQDYAQFFYGRLRTIEQLLETQDFACAGRFTAADISLGYALMLARVLGLHERFGPAVGAYWSRLSARAGFERAMAVQEETAARLGLPLVPTAGVGHGRGAPGGGGGGRDSYFNKDEEEKKEGAWGGGAGGAPARGSGGGSRPRRGGGGPPPPPPRGGGGGGGGGTRPCAG